LFKEAGRGRRRGSSGLAQQADAARCAGGELDGPFACQGLEMVFGGVGRLEAQGPGDFGSRGRKAGTLDFAADDIQDLLLTLGKLGGHGLRDIR